MNSAGSRIPLPDALGSVRVLLDAGQNLTDGYAFEGFGRQVSGGGSTPNPYRYVGLFGYYEDQETGLCLLSARYYDPVAGRFLTRDPIDYGGGDWGLYGYVAGGVTSRRDPVGLRCSLKWRPVGLGPVEGPGDETENSFSHWYVSTNMCGDMGYGPNGVSYPNSPGVDFNPGGPNVQQYGKDIPCSSEQEKCLCQNGKAAGSGAQMCGPTWPAKGVLGLFWHSCHDFANCLLSKCGLPFQEPVEVLPPSTLTFVL